MKLADDLETTAVDNSNLFYQLRQLRTKFHHRTTFMKLRASFSALNSLKLQPCSLFTLVNFSVKKKR